MRSTVDQMRANEGDGTKLALGPTLAFLAKSRLTGSWNLAAKRAMLALALVTALAFGGWHLGQGMYIPAKAWLAQALLERTWQRTLEGGPCTKPWPWADTYPVARIEFPRVGKRYLVLAGSSGRTLAFGPGHVSGSALPGEAGNSVIGAHRDTHFAALASLQIGDIIVVQRPDAMNFRYRVLRIEVLHKSELQPLKQGGPARLTLITCFPFDTLRAGGPLRYVVIAQREPQGLHAPGRPVAPLPTLEGR